ncbi:RICIN domain-containing protein [Geodermatophilus siccatus]|uniref:RICIN domain-containing protein n=1 Tax=Geodermatophilus siccatus TaxID=1137991 RepID=UPI001114573C|nr:hypothetical protein [Geodermatophilus siccatus]
MDLHSSDFLKWLDNRAHETARTQGSLEHITWGRDLDAPRVETTFHAYRNTRPDIDWNTCGQAAIATIIDFHRIDPFGLPRNAAGHWDDGAIIDAIINDGQGPDVVFGWGTTPGRIAEALGRYGCIAKAVCFPPVDIGLWRAVAFSQLAEALNRNLPVPVLVDLGRLNGTAFTFHWPVAYKLENGRVHLGNMASSWNATPNLVEFVDAWTAWPLPGYHLCAVYARFERPPEPIPVNQIQAGMQVGLWCWGDIPGPRWLDGVTPNGTVVLSLEPSGSGSRWRLHDAGGAAIHLECLGDQPGPRWLDGVTPNGTVVLSPDTGGSGSRWRLHDAGGAAIHLECLGDQPGPRWLDGVTPNGTVVLSPDTGGSGSRWIVTPR